MSDESSAQLDSLFRGNKVYGRLYTCEIPPPPPKMLHRRAGRCSEPLRAAQARYEAKSWWEKRLTEKDAWGNPADQLAPKQFQQQCEMWPDAIPEAFLAQQQQRLIDHQTGKHPLPPEESLRLRRDVSLLHDIYQPGPRYEAPLSPEEEAWLAERKLRDSNSLAIAVLGPVFGGPGAATRMLGGSEQQVAAANQVGAILMDVTTAHVGIGGRRGGSAESEPVPRKGAVVQKPPKPKFRGSWEQYITYGPKYVKNPTPALGPGQRIRVGTNGKVAIIGRDMKVVRAKAAELKAQGYDVEIFDGDMISVTARKTFLDVAQKYPNGWIPDIELPKTIMYEENMTWAKKLVGDGYTVLDTGNPSNLKQSPFYSGEGRIIFGDP